MIHNYDFWTADIEQLSPHIREEEILHQLSLVVYRVLYIPRGDRRISSINRNAPMTSRFWIPKSHPGVDVGISLGGVGGRRHMYKIMWT